MSNHSFQFQSLTPDTIHQAITQLGFYPESGLQPLNSYENRVYLFTSEDRQRYVVKFYRPERWSDEQIKEEHQFIQFLASHDIPVIAPFQRDGQTLFDCEGYRYALTPYKPGRAIELDNQHQLGEVGEAIGRFHAVSQNYQFKHRDTFTQKRRLNDPVQYLRAQQPWVSGEQETWSSLLHALENKINDAAVFKSELIALHGDCHAGNILWRDEPVFVDFDDACQGPAMQDLWMLLSGQADEQRQQLYLLLDGYEQYCEFDDSQFTQVEILRTLRQLNYMVWLHQRKDDPAFIQAFPWFYQPQYWQQQRQYLSEQLERLESFPVMGNFNY